MRFEFSAGGVVYKNEKSENKDQKNDLLILVSQHSFHHGWVFPKGLIGDKMENKDQGKEETALREVEEETGARAIIEHELTPTSFWYEWKGEKIKKTVYYYVMKYIDGDITKHDDEMEAVEWLKPEEVEKRLTYSSDKKVWKEAWEIIKNN
jgi:8-oxo-dGTP diphosphatase